MGMCIAATLATGVCKGVFNDVLNVQILDVVVLLAAVFVGVHKVRIAQHFQVLRRSRLGEANMVSQLENRVRPVDEGCKNAQSRFVAECGEDRCGIVEHLIIHK